MNLFGTREKLIVRDLRAHDHQWVDLTLNYAWCLDCGALRMWNETDGARINAPALVRLARTL